MNTSCGTHRKAVMSANHSRLTALIWTCFDVGTLQPGKAKNCFESDEGLSRIRLEAGRDNM
eukprot:scaffold525979_cov23-Prasinocladus_malaysianus.AAC.1